MGFSVIHSQISDVKYNSENALNIALNTQKHVVCTSCTVHILPVSIASHTIFLLANLEESVVTCSSFVVSVEVSETAERIDLEKLKVREQIMFFNEVLLFEDELHDHGVSMIGVKIVSAVLSHLYIINLRSLSKCEAF